jgi:hypothetical protein
MRVEGDVLPGYRFMGSIKATLFSMGWDYRFAREEGTSDFTLAWMRNSLKSIKSAIKQFKEEHP